MVMVDVNKDGARFEISKPAALFADHQQKEDFQRHPGESESAWKHTQMPAITVAVRNVFVYDASGTSPMLVAGWRQYGTMTTSEFYSSLALCLEQPVANTFRLVDGNQTMLPNDGSILPICNYFVVSASPFIGLGWS